MRRRRRRSCCPAQRPASPEIAESPSETTVSGAQAGAGSGGGEDDQRPARVQRRAHPVSPPVRMRRSQTTSRLAKAWRRCRRVPRPSRSTPPRPASTPQRLRAHRPPLSAATSTTGKLPGFLAVIARDGQVVHVAKGGLRDVEAGLPVERRHAVAHLLDDQADHVGRGDDAVGGGRVRAQGPGRERSSRRSPTRACGRAAASTSRSPRPALEPVRMWHLLTHTAGLDLRLPLRAPARRRLPRPRLRVRRAAGHGPRARACDAWAALPLLFEPGTRVQLLRLHRRARPAWSRCSPGSRSTCSSRSASSARSGMTDTALRRAPTRTGWPRSTSPGSCATTAWARPRCARPTFLSGGGGLVSTAADYHRFTHDAARRGGGRRRLLGTAYAALHGPQPPARRRRAEGRRAPDDLRDPERRAWASGSASPSCSTRRRTKVARRAGRARLGRAGQHRVLGRPAGAHHARSSSPS